MSTTLLPGRLSALRRLAEEREQTASALLSDAAWIGLQILDGKDPQIPSRESELSRIAALRGTSGYERAVQRFVRQNLKLAYSYAQRWRCKEIPMDDLKQQAVIGLTEAVRRYDPSKGRDWSTWALLQMRYVVQRHVSKKEVTVHTPQTVIDARRLVERAQRANKEPTIEELCTITGLSRARIEAALEDRIQMVPLDEAQYAKSPLGPADDGPTREMWNL